MKRIEWNDWLLLLWTLLVLAFAIYPIAAHGQTRQLSTGQPFSSVWMPSLPVATAERVVYAQDSVRDGAFELWSASIDGGAPVRLSEQFAAGQSVKFAIAPDGVRVIYSTDQDVIGIPDLYMVPIDGGPSIKLSMNLSALPGQVRDFIVSPTSQRVYFAADGNTNNVLELYRVDVGGGPTTKLNRAIGVDYDVFEYLVSSQDRIVYRTGTSTVGKYKLYSVPGTGRSVDAREISRDMVTGGSAMEFALTPDGQHTIYRGDALENGRFDLFSVPTIGGTSTRLDKNDGRSVRSVFTVDATGVTYSYTPTEWYRVPVTGGTPVPVPPPVEPPVTSPDGRWFATHAASVLSLTRHGCTTAIDRPVVTTFIARPAYSISPDSKRVVFISGGEVWTSEIRGSVCLTFNDGFETGGVTRWN